MHFVRAKGLLSQGNGMNLYRGCTHHRFPEEPGIEQISLFDGLY